MSVQQRPYAPEVSGRRERRRALVACAVVTALAVTLVAAAGSVAATPPAKQPAVVAAPPTNTGLPQISGTPVQGQTLTTSNGTWQGGATSFDYGWFRCDPVSSVCSVIQGANSNTYTLTADDVGSTIRSQVVAISSGGSGSAESNPTATVTAPPSNTGLPQISGAAFLGQTLTTSNGAWTNTPTGFRYQWLRCDPSGGNCAAISGAANTGYQLTTGDVGDTIRVTVTASNAAGTANPVTSAPTVVVQSVVPVSQGAPSITGAATVGQRLTETHGLWSNSPTSYAYQWLRCRPDGGGCISITGAASSTYMVSSADVGSTIRAQETASNAAGAGSPAVSSATAVVPPPPPLRVSATSLTTSGPTMTVSITCQGQDGEMCLGQLTLTTRERTHGPTVVAVTARHGGRVTTVALGHASFAVPAPGHARVSVTIDAAGRRLLGEFYKLPAHLSFTGTIIPARTITFTYPRINALIRYTASYNPRYTTMPAFSVIALPAHASVQMRCTGPGCPFRAQTTRPKHASVDRTHLFGGAHLLPGATVQVAVTAPNMIGEVEAIRIRAGAPRQTDLCLVPGVKAPQRCR